MRADLKVLPGGASDPAAGKPPPHDEGAEMSVVLSSMVDPSLATQAVGQLREEHFYSRRHRTAFRAIATLLAAGQPTDIVSVMSWLREQGRLGEWGHNGEFATSFDGCPGVTSMDRAAKIIRDAWRMREAVDEARLLIARAHSSYDAQECLDACSERMFRIAGDTPTVTAADSLSLAKGIAKSIREYASSTGYAVGVKSGFRAFDDAVAGFAPGALAIVGARPGMGKTSFLLALAVNAAKRGERVYFATCEMPNDQLALRCVCSMAGVSYERYQKGECGDNELARVANSVHEFAKLPIAWDSLTAPTVPEVRAKVERTDAEFRRKGGPLRLVIVDYLGKMRATGVQSNATAEEKAANIAENCKNAAKKTDVPWVVAAQLNRKVSEGGKIRRPQMTDLRGSGVIENEADTILFIHREDYAQEQVKGDSHQPNQEAEIIVSKQRNGSTPTVTLRFIREFTRFEDP